MTTLIDLSPTHRGGRPVNPNHQLAHAFEVACEFLDQRGDALFSEPELFRACWSSSASRQLIRFYLALGFIERVSEPSARPVFYRVLPHAMPKQVAA